MEMIRDPMVECPDENQLAQFAHGGLTGEERVELERHLDACSGCRQLVAAVAAGSAPLAPRESLVHAPGERLGRYEIERLLSVGGMGVLYVARDTQLDRRVVLKLMRPAFSDEAGKARLLREAQAMARLAHPNVVNVFDLGEVDGRLFLAMELVEGTSMREWLRTPRPWRVVLSHFLAAGDGLAAAHRAGVIHRDFKPDNVLLGADGRIRVGDFGLARPGEAITALLVTGPVEITQAGALLGTPAYMSPEQYLRRPTDERSDQFSFCVALYEALAGRRPFDGATLEEVRTRVLAGATPSLPSLSEVPRSVWKVLARGLAVEPMKRFPTLEALLSELRSAASARPRQLKAWKGLAAVGVLMLLLAGAAVSTLMARPPSPVAPFAAPGPVEGAGPGPTAATLPKSVEVTPLPVVLPDGSSSSIGGLSLQLVEGARRRVQVTGLGRSEVTDATVVDIEADVEGFWVRARTRGVAVVKLWREGVEKPARELYVVVVPKVVPPKSRELMPEQILYTVMEQKREIGRCAGEAKEKERALAGKVVLKWTIRTDGAVHKVSALPGPLQEHEVTRCLMGVVASLRFPPHEVQGEPVVFPFKI